MCSGFIVKRKIPRMPKGIEVCVSHAFIFHFLSYFVALANGFCSHNGWIATDLLDALPEKRKLEDGGYLSDDGGEVSSSSIPIS